jgi:hypothetical protein
LLIKADVNVFIARVDVRFLFPGVAPFDRNPLVLVKYNPRPNLCVLEVGNIGAKYECDSESSKH